MKTNSWIASIAQRTGNLPSALTVYLDVDPSKSANLSRKSELRFKEMAHALRSRIEKPAERARFDRARRRAADFLKDYRGPARTLAMFADAEAGSFHYEELATPGRDAICWNRTFQIRDLIAAEDELHPYAVLLMDRAHVRAFTVLRGQIEEVAHETFSRTRVRHIKTVGTDHWGSSSHVQRKADEVIKKNLHRAVALLDSVVTPDRIDRIFLAGTHEIVCEARLLLSKRLAARLIGDIAMDIGATPPEILEATMPLAERFEQASDEARIRRLAASAVKRGRGVIGLSRTLRLLNESRLRELVCSEDFRCPGFECRHCGALFSIKPNSCSYCGGALAAIEDIVEMALQAAIRKEAKVEMVRAGSASLLDRAGGIGGLVKARPRASAG